VLVEGVFSVLSGRVGCCLTNRNLLGGMVRQPFSVKADSTLVSRRQELKEQLVELVEKSATQATMIHPATVELLSEPIHRGVDLLQFGTGPALAGKPLLEQKPLGTSAE
jgi:hypothetical protein